MIKSNLFQLSLRYVLSFKINPKDIIFITHSNKYIKVVKKSI
jgi:hypothetical protein